MQVNHPRAGARSVVDSPREIGEEFDCCAPKPIERLIVVANNHNRPSIRKRRSRKRKVDLLLEDIGVLVLVNQNDLQLTSEGTEHSTFEPSQQLSLYPTENADQPLRQSNI